MNILAMCPDPRDATSYYRGSGPLGALQKKIKNLKVSVIHPDASAEWNDLALCDLFFAQRPCTAEHVRLMTIAKDMNIPVWVDYDDDLANISMDNPTFDFYYSARQVYQQAIELADVITCTTEDLKEKLGPKARVIENAWNDFIFPWPKEFKPRTKGVFWRGGSSHQMDLASVKNCIASVHENNPSIRWTFMAAKPWSVFSSFKDTSKMDMVLNMNIISYFKQLKNFDMSVAICPLVDNTFNRSKSNIAWIEATAAGMCVVAPKFAPWPTQEYGFPYAQGFFGTALEHALLHHEEAKKRHAISSNLIQNCYMLSKVNDQRIALLEEFVK